MSTIRVDRITPYQSGSVAIESLSITNLSIEGTLTASIQEGHVLVGGSGNVSTLTPTSSFGGGGSTDITALNSFTASQENLNGTFAITGSNSFVGNQNITGSLSVSGAITGSQVGNIIPFYFANRAAFPSASTYHGAIAHSHSDGKMYYAHGGIWIELANTTGSFTGSFVGDGSGLTGISGVTPINTGSFATTGSNVLIGTQIISGSILVSGSINSDGYQLEASSTTTIPVLNSTFNLDLVPSGSTTTFINKSLVIGDGKVLIAGRFQSIDGHTTNDIARLNSDGTIDTSFTAPMFSGSNFVGGDTAGWINTFVTQSDDKIIVVGNFIRVGEGIDARRGIARLNANGTLDETFVTQSFDSFASSNGVRDVVIQDDGKIVFVGTFTSGSRRVNSDGTLDTTFDVAAAGLLQFNNQVTAFNDGNFHSVALLNSGSEQAILIGGSFTQWGSFSSYPFLVKLNPNGALDFDFAGTNLDIATGNSLDRIQKIKVTDAYSAGDNGYIYIAGRFKDTGIGNHAGFAIVLPTDNLGDGRGALDNGFRTYISGSFVNDFDFYDGDKILLGGSFTTFGNPASSVTSANRFAIIDQNDGGLVTNWLTDGLSAKYNLNTGAVNSVTLLPNNNVLLGGTFTQANSTAREGLASLKLTGFGDVTTTTDYSITGDTNELLISSSNTRFSGDITASSFSGSFVGNGSGLTDVNVGAVDFDDITNKPTLVSSSQQVLNYGIFATTGSNTFRGNQTITGSVLIDGNLNTPSLRNYNSLFGTPSSEIVNFNVLSVTKTSNHRYFGTGSAIGYHIDGVESPFLTLLPGKTYRFNQSDASNNTHQLRFYYQANKTTQYTTNVTHNGTAGQAGAYTQIVVTDTTPTGLHYQCINHGYMGNSAQFNSNVIDTPYLINAQDGVTVTGNVTATTFNGDISYAVSGRWVIGANSNSDYTFTGIGFLSTTNDPILYLARGAVYEFVINSGASHPFQIRVSNGGSAYNNGVTNNTATGGVIRFEIPFNAPNTLYYQCTSHSGMGNTINVYPSI